MVVLSGQRLLQRWSLKTFEREKVVPLPGKATVLKALMGCNSLGPLVLWSGGPVELWDVQAMKPIEPKGKRVGGRNQWNPTLNISANGQAVIWSHAGLSPSAFSLMRITRGNTTTVLLGGLATSSFALLNTDASLVFSHGLRQGIFNGNWQAIPAQKLNQSGLIPTEDPRFFLAVSRTNDGKNSAVSFCIASSCRSVFTLNNLEPLSASASSGRKGHFLHEPRVHYLPEANLFVTLPEGNEKIIVRNFDLLATLEKSSKPYLFVLSTPKLTARPGTRYVYQLDVKSKSGGLNFKCESGPEGLAISQAGRLT
jgi:hypothetical protein